MPNSNCTSIASFGSFPIVGSQVETGKMALIDRGNASGAIPAQAPVKQIWHNGRDPD
ncbi:hypothetical protein [uncultured Hoeflea sp.]|uniref:hypothetical protein n=1 Tax=uncultured Hoeflea sp. TaxID=538666 RepID=UPI0030DC8678